MSENSLDAWRSEFIRYPRSPRPAWKYIEDLLLRAGKPKITFKEKTDHTLIMVRLPVSTNQLPKDLQKMYSSLGVRIKDTFYEMLAVAPRKGMSTFRSELSKAVYNSYRHAWLHLEKELYLGKSHPAVDAFLSKKWDTLWKNTTLRAGRQKKGRKELVSTQSRFEQLLRVGEEIHSIVENGVDRGLPPNEIRKIVYSRISDAPWAEYVFSSQDNHCAWKKIPYGRRIICLHDPGSWTPRQLAIALLALQSKKGYQTIEKKLANFSHTPAKVSKRN